MDDLRRAHGGGRAAALTGAVAPRIVGRPAGAVAGRDFAAFVSDGEHLPFADGFVGKNDGIGAAHDVPAGGRDGEVVGAEALGGVEGGEEEGGFALAVGGVVGSALGAANPLSSPARSAGRFARLAMLIRDVAATCCFMASFLLVRGLGPGAQGLRCLPSRRGLS